MSLTSSAPSEVAKAASVAARTLAVLPESSRNEALLAIHSALTEAKDIILEANLRDVEAARKSAQNGELSLSVLSRLDLGKKGKWDDMLKGILDVKSLKDPGMFKILSLIKLCHANEKSRRDNPKDPNRRWTRARKSDMPNWCSTYYI
jgi:gamma-glutamyl phosphate reductase